MKAIYLSDTDFEKDSILRKPTADDISSFEQKISNYIGGSEVVALNSGTAAIHLALKLANVKKDDLVISQSFTYVASVNPVIYCGASPIFVDSEKESWGMCPNLLEKAIKESILKGKKPKAIIFVHVYGMPAMIREIAEIAKKYEIILIEDAAEALGSSYNGRKCGTFGDFGILSFNTNKTVTTFGGGALICKTISEKQKAVYLATQAKDNKSNFIHGAVAYNYRINPLAAMYGLYSFAKVDENINRKQEIHTFYKEIFNQTTELSLFSNDNSLKISNYWLNCVTSNNRDIILKIKNLFSKNGVETRPLWQPMHKQKIYSKYISYSNGFSEELSKNGICLPSGSGLLDEDLKKIKLLFHSIL